MNENYRLQLLNHGEIFATREEAIEYINDNYKGVALWSEPALFFYGSERDPKMILAVGATKNSTRPRLCLIDNEELIERINEIQDVTDQHTEQIEISADRILGIVNSVGLTLDENKRVNQISYDPDSSDELIRDAETVAEAISIISQYAQEKVAEMELTVVDSDTVDFDYDVTPNGSTLTANVKISEDGADDDLDYNNNIVGAKNDGIFASCNLEYDSERNRLIFTASGMKNGRFVTDAIKKIIDLGEHTIYTADNEGHSVILIFNQETKKVSGDVRLDPDNSIQAVPAGLKANVDIDIDQINNKLTLRVGNNEKVMTLPGASIIDDIYYDSVNKVIVITWKDGSQQTVIPVADMLRTWIVQNNQLSPIVLTKSEPVTAGDPEILSADIKIAQTDNLIGKDSYGQVYVHESVIDNKIATETSARVAADNVLTTAVQSLTNRLSTEETTRHTEDDDIRSSVSDLSDTVDVLEANLTAEVNRARTAETTNATAITNEVTRATAAESTISQNAKDYTDLKITTEKERAITAETENANDIVDLKAKDLELESELANKIESVTIVKDSQSDLQYILKVDGVDAGEINIPKDQFLRTVTYNPLSKDLVFVFETTTGTETTLVNIGDLVDTYLAGNGLTLTSNVFSIKINPASEFVSVDENGLKVSGISEAIAVNTDAIAIINGNESQNGSIKKALADAKDYTDTSIATVNQALNTKADKTSVYTKTEIDTQVDALEAEDASLNVIPVESNSVRIVKSKDASGTELTANVKLDTSSTNIIKITGNGVTADVEMSYNQASNTITFNNGVTTQNFQLAGTSLLEDGYYNSTTKKIVLVTRLADGTVRNIEIDADALIHTLKVQNSVSNPIKLTKTTDSEGVDVLSGSVDISTETNNLILNNNGTLYASKQASAHTGLWAGEEKSLQVIIELLKTETDKIPDILSDISSLESDVQQAQSDIITSQADIAALETAVDDIETDIDDVKAQVTAQNTRLNSMENTIINLTGLVNSISTRIGNIESDLAAYKVATDARLNAIEEVINNLIDFGED